MHFNQSGKLAAMTLEAVERQPSMTGGVTQKGSNDGPGKETTRPKNKKGARRESHELKIVLHGSDGTQRRVRLSNEQGLTCAKGVGLRGPKSNDHVLRASQTGDKRHTIGS